MWSIQVVQLSNGKWINSICRNEDQIYKTAELFNEPDIAFGDAFTRYLELIERGLEH